MTPFNKFPIEFCSSRHRFAQRKPYIIQKPKICHKTPTIWSTNGKSPHKQKASNPFVGPPIVLAPCFAALATPACITSSLVSGIAGEMSGFAAWGAGSGKGGAGSSYGLCQICSSTLKYAKTSDLNACF